MRPVQNDLKQGAAFHFGRSKKTMRDLVVHITSHINLLGEVLLGKVLIRSVSEMARVWSEATYLPIFRLPVVIYPVSHVSYSMALK